MGKNYERYAEAKQNLDLARHDLAVANGGSTRDHLEQTKANLAVSQQAEAVAWNELTKDPEG